MTDRLKQQSTGLVLIVEKETVALYRVLAVETPADAAEHGDWGLLEGGRFTTNALRAWAAGDLPCSRLAAYRVEDRTWKP